MSWISHVKAYQAKHPNLSYGEAMKAAKSSYKRKSGKGLIGNLKKAVKYSKERIFFPADKLPGSAQKAYDKLKGATVKSIMVNRKPVSGIVEKMLNFMSIGTYEKEKKKLGYDKMFHLSMVLTTNQGRIAVEKNERINIAAGGTGGGESIEIAYDRGDTFASFLEKARWKMGDHKFFQYNAFENNCQDFIIGLLSANGVLSAEAKKFVKQDAESLLKAMPGFVGRVAQAATDVAGKISERITGQGRKRKKKNVK